MNKQATIDLAIATETDAVARAVEANPNLVLTHPNLDAFAAAPSDARTQKRVRGNEPLIPGGTAAVEASQRRAARSHALKRFVCHFGE
ncbi:hypothetical protein Q3C01_37740 [Bradyrhizobium sp. UFLA05-109]